MIRKIELNDLGEIIHVYTRYFNPGEEEIDPQCPDGGIEVSKDHYKLFAKIQNDPILFNKVYKFNKGKFEKKKESEVTIELADWVDQNPTELPKDYNLNTNGTHKSKPKKIEELTLEELIAITKPIPVYSDFRDIPKTFIKKNNYKFNEEK